MLNLVTVQAREGSPCRAQGKPPHKKSCVGKNVNPMTNEEVAEIYHGNVSLNSSIVLGLSWWLTSKEAAC